MNTISRRVSRLAATAAAAGSALALGGGVAAADEWPVQEPNSAIQVSEATFLTPTDPAYWNPLDARGRLTSPYGNSTRVVCSSFHGVAMSCFQADRDGNPHKLVALPFNFPSFTGSSAPGGGASNWVYPGYLPGIG
ncbi:hypothetical protein [Nocardia jejuensis]|uniref:hypothetical protein n=1 Tax=Nocardia jejuensis TaxID=328049 RepID=UPI00082A27C4|nr:hypothetical protein [Nocardia jejuensis]